MPLFPTSTSSSLTVNLISTNPSSSDSAYHHNRGGCPSTLFKPQLMNMLRSRLLRWHTFRVALITSLIWISLGFCVMIYYMGCLGSDGINCKSTWSSGSGSSGSGSGSDAFAARFGREAGPGPGVVHDETASAILGGNQKSHESHPIHNNEEDSDNRAAAIGYKGRGFGDGNSVGGNRGLFIHKLKPAASQSISLSSLGSSNSLASLSYSAVSPYLPPYPINELKLWEPPRKYLSSQYLLKTS